MNELINAYKSHITLLKQQSDLKDEQITVYKEYVAYLTDRLDESMAQMDTALSIINRNHGNQRELYEQILSIFRTTT